MRYPGSMATEVWVRNPNNYIKECIEVGIDWLAWDFGCLKKNGIDPHKFAQLFYGIGAPWRAMVIGEQGAVEINDEHDLDNPLAVYPTWVYGQSWERLEEFCARPVGGNPYLCLDPNTPIQYRPVLGQDHRVVIIRPPQAGTGLGRSFFNHLSQLQDENPGCIIHIHGLYSFRYMFGLSFKSVDIEPRKLAQGGKVVLPSGKEVGFSYAAAEPHWVNLIGFTLGDLRVPRNRCMFNIKSAMWAAEHFKEAIKFRTKGFSHIDPDDPTRRSPRNKSIMVRRKEPQIGDKFVCDSCSLATSCKYYRTGAVCIVPDSDAVELARFFKTRDSGQIIDGLGDLLSRQAERLQKALDAEEEKDELHPEVTKIINTLFDRGVKLAKLVDPRLAAAGAPNLNLTQINASTPQGFMAAIVQQLVDMGIPRSQINPEMVLKMFENPDAMVERAIEVSSAEKAS